MKTTERKLRIKEALEYHNQQHPDQDRMQEIELARIIYQDEAKPKSLSVKMSNLVNGKVKRIDVNWIERICKATGVDANFLFGIDPMKK